MDEDKIEFRLMCIYGTMILSILTISLLMTPSISDVIDMHGPPYKNSIPTYIDEDVMWIGAEGDTLWE